MNRNEIEERATQNLKKKFVDNIIVMLIMVGMMYALNMLMTFMFKGLTTSFLMKLLEIAIPIVIPSFFAFGFLSFYLKVARDEEVTFKELFNKINMFKSYILITLLMGITLLILMLLLIWIIKIGVPISFIVLPIIFFSLNLALVYYVKLDNESTGTLAVFKKSIQMMKGYKWKLFKLICLILTIFILFTIIFSITYMQLAGEMIIEGAIFLSTIPKLIIGAITIFWVCPHMIISLMIFADDIKKENLNFETNISNVQNNNVPSTTTNIQNVSSATTDNQDIPKTEEDINSIIEKQKELISNMQNQNNKINNNIEVQNNLTSNEINNTEIVSQSEYINQANPTTSIQNNNI